MKRLETETVADNAREAARYIARNTPLRPFLGLILGSGWAATAQGLAQGASLDCQDIPHFSKPRVQGHPGRLVLGLLSGRPVAVFCGRPHLYEGYSMAQVAFPVLTLKELGVKALITTNAAGGLDPSLRPGDLMLITDHINLPGLAGSSPLAGLEGDFVDMAQAYDPALREVALKVASSVEEPLQQGVYAMVGGPSYETAAEARFLRGLGADAVGMSTVPEVVAARWAGLRVLGLSLITNLAIPAETEGRPAEDGPTQRSATTHSGGRPEVVEKAADQPDSRPFPGPAYVAEEAGGPRKARLSGFSTSPCPPAATGSRGRPSPPRGGPALTHEEVLRMAEEASPRLRKFVEALVGAWPRL